jgi:DNA-binding NarL/FixJ family response regulator
MQGKPSLSDKEAVDTIGVLVVDSHPVLRMGISRLLNEQQGFNVVGDAADSRTAFEATERLRPDVVLIDTEFGAEVSSDTSGFAFIRRVVSRTTGSRVLVYTAENGGSYVLESVRNGARGYVVKTQRPERVYEAMRVVADGGFYLDPAVTSLVMNRMGRLVNFSGNFDETLSNREQAVLDRLVAGKRNGQIAGELFISERTVKFHVTSLFRKLRAKSRTDVVRIALQQGLV